MSPNPRVAFEPRRFERTDVYDRTLGKEAIDRKWTPSFGQPVSDYVRSHGALYRQYENAVIALQRAGAVASWGAIFAHWRETGGVEAWGLPLRDEEAAPNAGRVSHFDGCSIWWHPQLGASEVHGAIRALWLSMGGPTSVAGFPVSDELGADLGSGAQRVSHFEKGDILWHADWGAIFVPKRIRLWYTGFFCVDESNEWSDADEPYMNMGVVVPGDPNVRVAETGVHSVEGGDKVRQALLLYEGPVRELVLGCAVKEHDEGDPHAFAGVFKTVLTAAADVGVTLLAGPEAIPAANTVLEPVTRFLGNKLSEATGAEDDDVGSHSEALTIRKLAELANSPGSGDPINDFAWRIGSDEQGIYDVWFNVEPA